MIAAAKATNDDNNWRRSYSLLHASHKAHGHESSLHDMALIAVSKHTETSDHSIDSRFSHYLCPVLWSHNMFKVLALPLPCDMVS
jgi:hypothetical protein